MISDHYFGFCKYMDRYVSRLGINMTDTADEVARTKAKYEVFSVR